MKMARQQIGKENIKQECIPVGCVLPVLYHTGEGPLSGRVCVRGVYVQGGLCRGDSLSGEVSFQGGLCLWGRTIPPPHVDRQTPVKLLPCPKLRLRAVIKRWNVVSVRVILTIRDECCFNEILNFTGKYRCYVIGYIFTARKRSLGQGNMFTGVCLSTGGCLVLGGAWSGGCLVLGGCLVPWGAGPCSRGVPASGGVPAPRGRGA